jgi:hypothetical protein
MDPRRLLDDPAELSELENRVLTAAGADPGAQLKQQMWSALSARLPPGGGPSGGEGASGPAAAGTAGSTGALGGAATAGLVSGKGVALASIAKAVSIGVALGIAATTAVFTVASDRPASDAPPTTAAAPPLGTDREHDPPGDDPARASPAAPAPAAAGSAQGSPLVGEPVGRDSVDQAAAAPAPIAGETDQARGIVSPGTPSVARFPVAPFPAATPASRPAPPAPVSSQPADPRARATSNAIREESRLVAAARDALRSGNAARALTLLEQARREFPRGTLAQEREALSIEALAASGQTGLAAERARRFLDAHPSSMHAARVRAFVRAP